MIITILPSSTNFHAIAYNEMKVEKGVATLLEAQNIFGLRPEAYTPEKLRQYFLDYSSRNTHIQNAQFHVAVSCKGSEYTHKQLLDIAHRYLKEMGYAEEGQPLLVYAHQDTDNNHIHIITSRVAPDGHKIDHNHEKRRSRAATLKIMEEYTDQRQEPEVNDVAKDALSYRYTSKAQFCAIMESLGYECKDDDEKPMIHLYRNGEELGTIQVQAHMKRKFGISLVFVGKADTPYGYIVVDHKNKTVFKGGEFISIKELLQFEDAATRFAKIEKTIDDLLGDNPKLTTADINRILYRQFGTRIHRGTVSWNGETIQLRPEVTEQLRQNYLASRGIHPTAYSATNKNSLPPQGDNRGNDIKVQSPTSAGATDTNREWELNGNMDMSVDDEAAQRRRWRR